ncbi:MAG: hypothetical protein EBR40_04545 [Proteobacteria bacterium]|nr:hypothetical protein [Pseudomonadota bacterium]
MLSEVPAVQFAMRDAAFNRGPTGAVSVAHDVLCGGILGLLELPVRQQTLDSVEHFGVVAVIDPGHLALPSPVTGWKMVDL